MILADENIDSRFVSILRSNHFDVLHIKENYKGLSDEKIIELSKNPPKIILTEDKDFGEWVYAHEERNISVILLRYHFKEVKQIIDVLLNLLESKKKELFGKFTTVTVHKVRIRSLK